jgi:membrane protease YdiL (CAAX protease family)
MGLMLRLNGETLKSVGLTRDNLWKATVVGLFLSTATLFFAHGGPGAAFKSTESHNVHSLLYFSFVGFGEEILYRGYLQSRLVAWLGHYQGWILASVFMALVHLPQRILIQGMGFPHALASSLALIPISLFMGFVMSRTGNVVAPGLSHTFADWVGSR